MTDGGASLVPDLPSVRVTYPPAPPAAAENTQRALWGQVSCHRKPQARGAVFPEGDRRRAGAHGGAGGVRGQGVFGPPWLIRREWVRVPLLWYR